MVSIPVIHQQGEVTTSSINKRKTRKDLKRMWNWTFEDDGLTPNRRRDKGQVAVNDNQYVLMMWIHPNIHSKIPCLQTFRTSGWRNQQRFCIIHTQTIKSLGTKSQDNPVYLDKIHGVLSPLIMKIIWFLILNSEGEKRGRIKTNTWRFWAGQVKLDENLRKRVRWFSIWKI